MCYQIYRETNIRVNETATVITHPSILVLSSDKTYRRVIKKESFKNINCGGYENIFKKRLFR